MVYYFYVNVLIRIKHTKYSVRGYILTDCAECVLGGKKGQQKPTDMRGKTRIKT